MSDDFRRGWYGSTDVMPEGAEVVPCVALGPSSRPLASRTLTFAALDVEGAELKVFHTLDLSAVHVNVIVIEQDGSSPQKMKQLGRTSSPTISNLMNLSKTPGPVFGMIGLSTSTSSALQHLRDCAVILQVVFTSVVLEFISCKIILNAKYIFEHRGQNCNTA